MLRRLLRASSIIFPTPPSRTILLAARAKPFICSAVMLGGIDKALGSVTNSTSAGPLRSRAVRQAVANLCGFLDANRVDPDRAGNRREIDRGVVGLEIRHAGYQHLELDHAQRRVVEQHDLQRQVVEANGEQLPEQHRQASVSGHGDDLTAWER